MQRVKPNEEERKQIIWKAYESNRQGRTRQRTTERMR